MASLLLKPAKTASTNSSTAGFCGNRNLCMINRGVAREGLWRRRLLLRTDLRRLVHWPETAFEEAGRIRNGKSASISATCADMHSARAYAKRASRLHVEGGAQ